MLWEVEIRTMGRDGDRERVCDEFDVLTSSARGADLVQASARGFLLEGDTLSEEAANQFAQALLVDPVVETVTVQPLGHPHGTSTYTVLLKPGVMDPVAESVLKAAKDLKTPATQVRTFRRYFGKTDNDPRDIELLFRRVLANEAIEQVVVGALNPSHVKLGKPYSFVLNIVKLSGLDDAGLMKVSREGTLALTIEEMRQIQRHFAEQQREPTDIELESIAQTWSEHCSHKTLKGEIEYTETINGVTTKKHFKNMLKETVFAATQTIRKNLGADDWTVSVFSDNAGIVKFNEQFHACIKVETHNRPSAIEPYGGANTGLGGVIRDVLGTGLGGKPVCNTDVFCFARPDYPASELPPGVLHPRRAMNGVVAGVRDYGNRMGIPTVNGSIVFEDRYLANPLVFCGTVGLIPVGMENKGAQPGDLIVSVGGRTGRDGIHGATFSSEGLHDESEKVSGGAVQIGNAIEEKKVLDVILQARDRGLYSAMTDCGAGGFSSAVGEMGADLGAHVTLETAPLKYDGLSYTEIWISESQERMVLAVPPAKWNELHKLCAAEGVEAACLGTFENTGKLKLSYHGTVVGEVAMHFLHDGRPELVRQAHYKLNTNDSKLTSSSPDNNLVVSDQFVVNSQEALLKLLSAYSICSKESVIRQYDHEVQGGSVIKPLVGVLNDGPSDAAVVMPVLGDHRGLAISNGLNPRYADIDPYHGAACAIDEAVRNAVAVGGDPAQCAILDNFCWGNVVEPEMLGALVRTSEACRDVAITLGTPFVSGKDSLNNSFITKDGKKISIPHTLLITAMAHVPNVTKCVTMDLKNAGNKLYLVGYTKDEMGGSHLFELHGLKGGSVPKVDAPLAKEIFAAMHRAIGASMVRSCHDCSEGGLAVALAEMCFSGEVGADITGLKTLAGADGLHDVVKLFSESPTRFVVEVTPEQDANFRAGFANLPLTYLGVTVAEKRLRIADSAGEWSLWTKLSELKEAWQKPLR
jgi:phosphoribosylformylglycinamidine synthase subunit PurSL